MINYYVITLQDEKGFHKMHTSTCTVRPKFPHIIDLGHYKDPLEALDKAIQQYQKVEVCNDCCPLPEDKRPTS